MIQVASIISALLLKLRLAPAFSIVLSVVSNPALAQIQFAAEKDIANGLVEGVSSMDVGDINGNGRGDVVVVEGGRHAGGRKTFAWYAAPAKIDGSWTRHNFGNDAQLRSFLGAVKLADMNGDGHLDLVISSDNHSGGSKQADVYVYVNPGPALVTGNWAYHRVTPSTLALHHINDMEIADMDGDGKLDIVTRSLSPNQLQIFFQNTISSYTRKDIDTEISESEGLGVGLLDSDSKPDITFTGHWLKSPSNPRSQNYTKLNIDSDYKNQNQNTKEAIGDIDGDGLNDVLLAPAEAFRGGGNTALAWYKNPGNTSAANWVKNTIVATSNNTHTVKLGDLDQDGDLDVVTGQPWSNSASEISVRSYYNNGNGAFGSAQVIESGKGLYSGALFDVDDDGDLDIIGQDRYADRSKPYVYENKSAGPVITPPPAPSTSQVSPAAITILLLEQD